MPRAHRVLRSEGKGSACGVLVGSRGLRPPFPGMKGG